MEAHHIHHISTRNFASLKIATDTQYTISHNETTRHVYAIVAYKLLLTRTAVRSTSLMLEWGALGSRADCGYDERALVERSAIMENEKVFCGEIFVCVFLVDGVECGRRRNLAQ